MLFATHQNRAVGNGQNRHRTAYALDVGHRRQGAVVESRRQMYVAQSVARVHDADDKLKIARSSRARSQTPHHKCGHKIGKKRAGRLVALDEERRHNAL